MQPSRSCDGQPQGSKGSSCMSCRWRMVGLRSSLRLLGSSCKLKQFPCSLDPFQISRCCAPVCNSQSSTLDHLGTDRLHLSRCHPAARCECPPGRMDRNHIPCSKGLAILCSNPKRSAFSVNLKLNKHVGVEMCVVGDK